MITSSSATILSEKSIPLFKLSTAMSPGGGCITVLSQWLALRPPKKQHLHFTVGKTLLVGSWIGSGARKRDFYIPRGRASFFL